MSFELFVRRSRPTTTQPVAAIQNRGSISLNKSAYALLEDRLPKGAKGEVYVQLLFDKVREVVAFKAVPKEVDNAYVVRKQPNAATYIVTGKGFLAYFGLLSEKLRRFRIRELENNLIGFSMVEDEIGAEATDAYEESDQFVQAPPSRNMQRPVRGRQDTRQGGRH